MKKTFTIALTAMVLFAVIASTAFAAANPQGNGQPGAPNVSCGFGNATNQPPGFLTDGFAQAASVYAGSDGTASLLHANSIHAISQYDIACYQLTANQ